MCSYADRDSHLNRWVLKNYIEVSAELGVIKPKTQVQADLAREYRDLIHPGRVQRLAQTCDRGTALAASAALERIVDDLS